MVDSLNMAIWHLHTRSWSDSQRRRIAHMVPESAETDPGLQDTPASAVGDAIVALCDAVKAATGQEVRVFTSGNLRRDAASFLTVTVLPYVTPVTVAPQEPLAETPADDGERRPCRGCPEK